VTQATDHDEISEVDDCDGSCDEEMASAMKLFSVEQWRQCEGDGTSQSAVWQYELVDMVESH